MATSLHNLSEHDSDAVPSGKGRVIGVVVSEWNKSITDALLRGAVDTLVQYDVHQDDIKVLYVPGSFELPLGAQRMIEYATPSVSSIAPPPIISGSLDAVICLGCVIQGETRHFDFICDAVANGIMKVMLKISIPIIFGLLTTNTLEQAQDRAGGKYGNKGVEAAITALKMMNLRIVN